MASPARRQADSPTGRGDKARAASRQSDRLDGLIHHRMRLGVLSALAGTDLMSFNEIKGLLKTTDGNLSVHARRLEKAGYVVCSKTFEERKPLTRYRLTAEGRRALQRYVDHMEALIHATRASLED